jgi:hypothetical protein
LVKNGHFTKWLSDLTYILTADEVKERYDSFSPLLMRLLKMIVKIFLIWKAFRYFLLFLSLFFKL